jgi:hypothetical protein
MIYYYKLTRNKKVLQHWLFSSFSIWQTKQGREITLILTRVCNEPQKIADVVSLSWSIRNELDYSSHLGT